MHIAYIKGNKYADESSRTSETRITQYLIELQYCNGNVRYWNILTLIILLQNYKMFSLATFRKLWNSDGYCLPN